jgi:hypothetical protein
MYGDFLREAAFFMQKFKGGIYYERILEHVTTYFVLQSAVGLVISLVVATDCLSHC